MKRIGMGSSLFALVFALQACGDDNQHVTKAAVKPDAPLARKDVVRFYNALLTTAIGQDALKGECGNVGKHLDRTKADPKTIKMKLPFKACQVDKLTLDGDLALAGERAANDAQPATVEGTLKVGGDIAGTCHVKLNYPVASVFEILAVINEDNADLNVLELSALGGKLCDVEIAQLIKEAEAARAAEADAAQAKADRSEAAKAKVDAARERTLQAQAAKKAAQGEAERANKEKVEATKARAKGKKPAETPAPEAPKGEAAKPAAPKADAPKADAPKPEAIEPDAPKPQAPQPDAPKPDALNPEVPAPNPTPEVVTPEAPQPEAAKVEQAQPEAEKPFSRKVRVPRGKAKATKTEANPATESTATTAG